MAKHGRATCVGIALLFAASVPAVGLDAQTFTATVSGRVLDPSGGVVPGAKISLRNVGTNWEKLTTTGSEGSFVLTLVSPGDYTLAVEAEGFKKEVRSGITLQVGQQAHLELSLALGERTEVVHVSEDAPLVQSENAALGGVVDQRQLAELPVNFRRFLSLAQLQPNVFLPAQGSTLGFFSSGFNVAGNSEVANNSLLDGIDNLDGAVNAPIHFPVLDAVREFRVLTGIYPAEYGRQSGGQVIVATKTGTNQFHGTAYEFLRKDNLDARNFFAPQKSELKRNQFGGTLGGPIQRDKAFLFMSYGGLRQGAQRAAVATVPTLRMHNGDFSELLVAGSPCPARGTAPVGPAGRSVCIRNPRSGANYAGNAIPRSDWHAAGKGLLDLYPTTNLRPGLVNNLPVAAVETSNLDQFSGRVDYRFGEKTTLFGSYNFSDKTDLVPILNPFCGARKIPGYGCDELQRTQHLALVLTHSFTPRILLEARAGYNRVGFFRLQEDRDQDVVRRLGIGGLPDVGVTPLNEGAPAVRPSEFDSLGSTVTPQGRHDNTYHYVANLTYLWGNHTFKGGTDIRRVQFNSFLTQFGRGEFRFTNRYTGHSIADLLLGLPTQADRNPGSPFHNAMDFSSGFYFQDDWKVTPHFTVNWGVRYELILPLVEAANKIASFDPGTNTLRVAGGREALPIIDTSVPGLVLRIRPRPDVGRRLWNTDMNNWAPRLGFAWKPWGSQRWVVRGGYGVYYNLQNIGSMQARLNRGLPFRLRQRFDNPSPFTASTFTLTDSFPAALAGNTLSAPAIDPNFRTAYMQQWSLGVQRELFKDLAVDVSYLGSKGSKLPQFINLNQCAAPCEVRPFPDWADIESRVSAAISNYHSLQVRVEKRFRGGFSLLSSYTWSKSLDNSPGITTISDASNARPQDSHNLRGERSRSDFDITHRYVLSYLFELPVGHGRRWLRNAHLLTDTLLGGWELTGILTLQSGAPFSVVLDDSQNPSGTFGFADRPNLVGDPFAPGPRCTRPKTPACWFNPDAFAIPPGSFGNFGRNALVGPALRNLDFGIFKNFPFREHHRIQFRAEFFNLTNHPNFGLPNHVLGGPSPGAITLAASGDNPGAQRQIQLGLKWSF